MTRSFLLVFCVISPISSARIPFDYPTEVPNSADYDSDYAQIEQGIVNGEQTSVEKYPFLAYVLSAQNDGLYSICTGSYIAFNMIITAHHCVTEKTGEKLGGRATLGTSYNKDYARMLQFHPENIHLYPDGGSGVLDIAIIVLDDKLVKKHLGSPSNIEKFGTVELAEDRRVEMGDWLTAAGWGLTNNSDPYSEPEYPRETQMEVVNCMEYDNICGFLGNYTHDRDAYFYAIGTQVTGSGTCSGDSGGPVLCDDGTLCGIAHAAFMGTLGTLCGVVPAHFVDLTRPNVQSWIRNMLQTYGRWF